MILKFADLPLVLAGKSSVLLDVKPWDDETDMKKLEETVRSVKMDGLLWGACMLLCSYGYFTCKRSVCLSSYG
jgi:elongation factor 1-beta